MNLKDKLEILKALGGNGLRFPGDQIYRDGANVMATNGWQVLAFDLSDAELSAPEFAELVTIDQGAKDCIKATCNTKHRRTPINIRTWLTREAETATADTSALRNFLRADDYLRCPCCAGSGRRPPHEIGEEMWVDDPFEKIRRVKVGGVLINANLLVAIFAHLPTTQTVMLSAWTQKQKGYPTGRILRIVGDGWTLVQMCLNDDDEAKPEVFELAEVSK